jgi:ABC-2 type transport system permease protein
MKNSIRRYWSIFWKLRVMQLMLVLEYRADFIFWAFISGMWTSFNFFFIHILASTSKQIGGWNENELFVLMSVFNIIDAFIWSFFYFNMSRYVNRVFNGELDGFLVKPVDTQFILSTEHNSYNNSIRLFIGIGMLLFSTSRLENPPGFMEWVLFVPLLLFGLLLLYSLWFSVATVSFWVERLGNINDIIPSLRRLAQVPRSVYTGIFSFVFCTIFPVALITSLPAEVLTGRFSLPWVVFFIGFSLFAFIFSRFFFHFSLKKYASVGS